MNNKLETLTNLFEGNEIRSIWDKEKEDYYFSVVDVISALTNSTNPRNYWNMLKSRLTDEGSELYTNCVQLKMRSSKDGKLMKCLILKLLQIGWLIITELKAIQTNGLSKD